MASPSEAPCKARPLSSEAPPVLPQQRPSSQPSNSFTNGDESRIFHREADAENPLILPCHCGGSRRYVHQACLQQWIDSSGARCCELWKSNFVIHTKTK
ncbi:hypothetical protein HPB48_012115 [Haemaphysalis longicornis]|uniref:RING-CH-type domain-containing protein n=1 Tax=Haemaphysalis longicornis TaxID=44386 RepID=A0A9J6H173_HAELO|nr:hypothetical protein HPB48_012115 [Haemaphysalis longicornis]